MITFKNSEGENNGRAKLTVKEAQTICRQAWAGVPNTELAKLFGISREEVSNIKHGRHWAKHTIEIRRANKAS